MIPRRVGGRVEEHYDLASLPRLDACFSNPITNAGIRGVNERRGGPIDLKAISVSIWVPVQGTGVNQTAVRVVAKVILSVEDGQEGGRGAPSLRALAACETEGHCVYYRAKSS